MVERTLLAKDWARIAREAPSGRELKYMAKGEPKLVEVRDGRKVAVRINGPDYGITVVRFHGNPGSSIAPRTPEEDLGIREVRFDRAGYGSSDRHKGLNIGDTAVDVLDIINTLNILGGKSLSWLLQEE